LYNNVGRICSKSEYFYRVYQGLDYEPKSSADPKWESPRRLNSLVDTHVSRLREDIEPDPPPGGEPIFVITVKGKGLRLDNVW